MINVYKQNSLDNREKGRKGVGRVGVEREGRTGGRRGGEGKGKKERKGMLTLLLELSRIEEQLQIL